MRLSFLEVERATLRRKCPRDRTRQSALNLGVDNIGVLLEPGFVSIQCLKGPVNHFFNAGKRPAIQALPDKFGIFRTKLDHHTRFNSGSSDHKGSVKTRYKSMFKDQGNPLRGAVAQTASLRSW